MTKIIGWLFWTVVLFVPVALLLGSMGFIAWDTLRHPDRLTAALVGGWLLWQFTGKPQ